MELPENVVQTLEKIAKKTNTDIKTLEQDYEEIFNDDFVQKDEQFKDDEDRRTYVLGRLHTTYISRPKVEAYNVIPIGADSIRRYKSGLNSSLFVLDKTGKIVRVALLGDITGITKEVAYFHMYKDVKLGSFRDSGDLIADDRAKFEEPIPIDMKPESLLETLKLKPVSIAEAGDHLSRLDEKGYPIKNDWKCIRGIIQYSREGTRDDGGEWGQYFISDMSVGLNAVTEEGNIVRGMTAWIAPNLMNYMRYSDCYFLGTLAETKRRDDTTEIQMNCYCIIPIHVQYED